MQAPLRHVGEMRKHCTLYYVFSRPGFPGRLAVRESDLRSLRECDLQNFEAFDDPACQPSSDTAQAIPMSSDLRKAFMEWGETQAQQLQTLERLQQQLEGMQRNLDAFPKVVRPVHKAAKPDEPPAVENGACPEPPVAGNGIPFLRMTPEQQLDLIKGTSKAAVDLAGHGFGGSREAVEHAANFANLAAHLIKLISGSPIPA